MSFRAELNDLLRGGLPELLDWPTIGGAPGSQKQFTERVPPQPTAEDKEKMPGVARSFAMLKNPWVLGGIGLAVVGIAVVALSSR